MALLNASSGIITDATTIQSFQGKLELILTEGNIIIDSNKLTKGRLGFTIPEASDTGSFRGFRLLGNASAISAATALSSPSLIIGGIFTGPTTGNVTFDAIVGKGGFRDTEILNKDLSFFAGQTLAVGSNYFLAPKAVAFARENAAQNSNAAVALEGNTITNDTIVGGTGQALLTHTSGYEQVLELDKLQYPFTIATANNITIAPIGSSVVLH